jgi:hypothetical protein
MLTLKHIGAAFIASAIATVLVIDTADARRGGGGGGGGMRAGGFSGGGALRAGGINRGGALAGNRVGNAGSFARVSNPIATGLAGAGAADGAETIGRDMVGVQPP